MAAQNKTHRHIKPLLCATYISGKNSLETLRSNMKATYSHCEWGIVYTDEKISDKIPPVSILLHVQMQTQNRTIQDSSIVLFQNLHNISSQYHRIW